MLHWQKRVFSNQEKLNLRRIKSAEKGLFLWRGWAAKGMFTASITEAEASILWPPDVKN